MSAYQEFTGKTVEEALRGAREAFGVELNDLDFEILTPGSRGVLGMGAEPARIVAAPRDALGGTAPKREAAESKPLPPAAPRSDGPRDDRPPRRDDRPPRDAAPAAPPASASGSPEAAPAGPRRDDRRPAATTDRPAATTDLVDRRPETSASESVPSSPRPGARPAPSVPSSRRPKHRPKPSRPARRSSRS